MKKLILIYFFSFTTILVAQNNVTIRATILDKETNQPVAFANIGFLEKGIGTVSNENGRFVLEYDESLINKKEVFQISVLGYKIFKIQASKLVEILSKDDKIYLSPQPYELEEVVLTNEKREQKTIGTSSYNEKTIGYWKDKNALGGEIATKINIKKIHTNLLEFQLHVEENLSDSIRIRLNVYNYKKRYPQENLLKANIFHTIKIKKGIESIDLRPYNIRVDYDIVIGVELVEVYGKKIGFALAANEYLGPSYTRYISQDKWKRDLSKGINFSVLVSVPTSKNKTISKVRKAPEKITLYWDTSLSMKERNIESELKLLSNYLKKVNTTEIEVIKFSTTVFASKIFHLENGNYKTLTDYLRNTYYDGASNYAHIVKQNNFNADVILLFTDGYTLFSELQPEINIPIFTINSLPKANHIQLQKAAFYAEGHYINLNKISTKLALGLMLNEVNDKTDYLTDPKTFIKGSIYGKVTNNSKPILNAFITVKNSFKETQTDIEGKYIINAKEGDILVINYLSMKQKKVLVLDKNVINIELQADGELLEEIVLNTEVKKEERIIDTPYGKKNFDAIGYAFDELKKKDIHSGNHRLEDVITKIPGIIKLGIGDGTRFLFARNLASSITLDSAPIIVIDDIIYYQSDGLNNLPPIDIQTIESVKAIKSIIGTNRYGGDGGGGAIIIRTQATSFDWVKKFEKNKLSALIKGNNYTEQISSIDSLLSTPIYLTALAQATSYQDALSIYKNQKEQASQYGLSFYFDTSQYFMQWDKDYALLILSDIAEIAPDNPKALKALAYHYEALKKFNKAKQIYQHIAILRPNDAQTYRDLAHIYTEIGSYEEAIDLYKQMLTKSIDSIDFTGLQKTIESEVKHLLKVHRTKINFKEFPPSFLRADFNYDIRMVFEWNNPNAEFELQFVNPQQKYFKWTHSKVETSKRMLNEIKGGYHTEEFIIDDANSGEWIINLQHLSDEKTKMIPNYIKYTIYKNYGLPNETKIIKVINLNNCSTKVTIDRFTYDKKSLE